MINSANRHKSGREMNRGKVYFRANTNPFEKNEKVSVSRDPANYKNLLKLHNNLSDIINEIGGIDERAGFLADLEKTKARIAKLELETKQAWSNAPKILEERIGKLKKLSDNLKVLEEQYSQVDENIVSEKSGIILPQSPKEKLLTDSMEAMSIYNRVALNTASAKKVIDENHTQTIGEVLTPDVLKKGLSELEKKNWSYEKLNKADSSIYYRFRNSVLLGKTKVLVEEQLKSIDIKLNELKNTGFAICEKTGLKVYDPETTGKILALETAKLRRSSLSQSVVIPKLDENLGKADILIQPTPVGEPLIIQMDKTHSPKPYEMKEILEQNSPFKPVLDKLFPKGLNLFVVPGYTAGKSGDLNGGMSIPGFPDEGIWLNSYNYEKKAEYLAPVERTIANIREVFNFNPSVLRGKDDRARALAHEIGHAICYSKMNSETPMEAKNSKLLLLAPELSFFDGWKALRIESKKSLNNKDLHPLEIRYLSEADKHNLNKTIDFEMIAEDIRTALTGNNLPASSKMTGIFDQSKEGEKTFIRVMQYIQEVLLNGKKPAALIFKK